MIPSISELLPDREILDGEKVRIESILNVPLVFTGWEIKKSKVKNAEMCLKLQFELDGERRVCGEFADLIEDLASKTDKITPEEFLQAAANGISSNLITFARDRGVPEAVITEGRTRIVEIMADAMRFGMTWSELITGVIPQA